MSHPPAADTLLRTLDDSLELLREYHLINLPALTSGEPLQSLLEQCEAVVANFGDPEPLRTIHHFACSGGTVISKVLAAMPNTVLLSEIDPLSTVENFRSGPDRFMPTDLILSLRQSIRPVEQDVILGTFVAGVLAAKEGIERDGGRLILRDHPHSQFGYTQIDYSARPTLYEMLSPHMAMLSVVTVRHPLDSFLSLNNNRWVTFQPGTLTEYSRRYMAFLDRHANLPIILYEDFVEDPEAVARRLCDLLDISFSPFGTDLFAQITLSGDSGRNEGPIKARPRRPVSDEIETARSESESYNALCHRLGYTP